MKTALEQLIEIIDNGIHNKSELIKTFGDYDNAIGNGIKYLKQVKEIATGLLETEKKQIVEAYDDGGLNGLARITSGSAFFDGTHYYSQTYKSN